MERDLRKINKKGSKPPRNDEEIRAHLDTVRTRIQDLIDKGDMPAKFRRRLRSVCRSNVLLLVAICSARVLHLGRVDDASLPPILITCSTYYLLSKLEAHADELESVI